ncbi:MAG: hypothetical protein Q9191_003573 [Dirinaria sp. TL-2023a]
MLSALQFGAFTFLLPVLLTALYGAGLAFYRLFLSPLAKFPGPKLAALTRKYESYYEAVRNYEYLWKIKKLHQQYGPIIRINPHEIHIDDPDFFDKLNSFQGKWNKDPFTAHQFANPHSIVGTIEHDIHRKRRMAILPFFSKQKIYALEPVIKSTVDNLCDKLENYVESGRPLNLRHAYQCFAADVVAEYCFAESGALLDQPNFASSHWNEHQKGLKDVDGPVRRMEEKKDLEFFEKAGHRTIFHELLNSDVLPPAEKGTIRIIQEAGAMVGAGGESTTQVLTALTFCLLANPDKLAKLREELRKVMPDSNSPMPTLKQLEPLPYLRGINASHVINPFFTKIGKSQPG